MNILIITGIFPPDIGGPASFVPSISKSLVEMGHNLSVITLSDNAKHHDSIYPFSVIRVPRRQPLPWRFIKTVIKIIQHGKSADLLFVNGLAFESVAANYFLQKPMVQKIVGDLVWERTRTMCLLRDQIDEFQTKKYTIYIEFLKKLRSFWTSKSNLIITPSNYLKKIITGWGVKEDKIKVIYNAFQNAESDCFEEPWFFKGIGKLRKKIVSVGRLVPWKGFDELIKAAGNISEAHLTIIGEGPERARLESLINEKNLQNSVLLTGSISRKEVFSSLKHSDLFVLNSSYEGFPHIVLEAMAAGVPVIAADAGGTPEIVQDGHNGILVPLSNSEFLESSIKKVLNDQKLKENLIKNGFETSKKYSWRNLVNQTEHELVNTAKKQGRVSEFIPETNSIIKLPVLFISTTRYSIPPDPTLKIKWSGLSPFFRSTVISFRNGPGPFRSTLEGSRWVLLPSEIARPVRYLLHFSVSFLLCLYGAIRKKYAAIIAQSPYEAIAPAIALLPWQIAGSSARPRLIIEIHSDWKEGVMLYHRGLFSFIEKPFRSILGHFSMSRADAYRPISEYCRGLIPECKKPVFIFPTFTDMESFKIPSDELIDEVADKHGRGFFLYAGMLIYLKGVHHLIRAFKNVLAKHPDVRLIIAGKGEEEKNLKNLTEFYALGDSVCFVGHLDQQTLGAYIINSNALVLPSLTEGLGRIAIEAHLLQKPVIASRVGGIPEIVLEGITGLLLDPGDEESLSSAIIKLIENPDIAAMMGKAGQEAVTRKFNYRNYFHSYYDMVSDVCKEIN